MARGPAQTTAATAPAGYGAPSKARIIGPADQRIGGSGKGNWSRAVRTILGAEHLAGQLLPGETLTLPSNWSSYPPNKHDREAPPHKVERPEGFAESGLVR